MKSGRGRRRRFIAWGIPGGVLAVTVAFAVAAVFATTTLTNIGFEDGLTGWSVSAETPAGNATVVEADTIPVAGTIEQSTGEWMLRLGAALDNNKRQVTGVSSVSQTFLAEETVIPVGFRVVSWEHKGLDTFTISLVDQAGAPVGVLAETEPVDVPNFGVVEAEGPLPYTLSALLKSPSGYMDTGWISARIVIPEERVGEVLKLAYTLDTTASKSRNTLVYLDRYNTPPVAEFRYAPTDPAPHEGDFVGLYGDFSYDLDGGQDLERWVWEITDPSGYTGSFEGIIPFFTPNNDGEHFVSLTVTDRGGASATTKMTIDVEEFVPRTNALDVEVLPGRAAALFGRYVDTGWLDEHEATWEFGPALGVSDTAVEADHTPSLGSGIVSGVVSSDPAVTPGTTYAGTLTVRQKDDASVAGTDELTVRVVHPDPYALHEDPSAADDSMADPASLEVLPADAIYRAFITPGDVDIYRIATPDGRDLEYGTEVRVELGDLPADYDLVLLSKKPTEGQDFDLQDAPAYISPAYISPAYLSPAYISPAYLSPAYLSPAYISPAYLSPAYISPAYLSPAYISPAYISSFLHSPVTASPLTAPAELGPAYLSPAYISPAYISPAYISPAYISPAYLSPAYISPAYISPAYLSPAYISPAYISAALHAPAYLSPAYLSGNPLDGVPLSVLAHAAIGVSDASGTELEFSEVGLDLSDAADGVEVVGYSARRGLENEVVFATVDTVYTEYYVAVVPSGGAYSETEPYALTIETSEPFDLVAQLSAEATFEPLVPEATTEPEWVQTAPAPKTLFVTQAERIAATYGAEAWADLEAKLLEIAARPEVAGSVLSVPSVIYDEWDLNPTSVTAANDVTGAIRGHIMTYLEDHPEIEYVVLVGSDEIVPSRRVNDEAVLGNESYYAERGAYLTYDSPLLAAMMGRYTLTNDYYVDLNPIPWSGRALYIPDRTIARLVETPAEIVASIDAYIAADGVLSGASLGSGLVTGHDFMSNGAQLVADMLADAGLGTTTLISDDWTGEQLRTALFGEVKDVSNPNAHFTHWTGMSASGFTDAMLGNIVDIGEYLLSTEITQFAGSDPGTPFEGVLVFSMGCHAGLNVPDAQSLVFDPASGFVPASDFPQVLAAEGGLFIGSTGYGYGDSIGVAGTERLMGMMLYEMLADGDGRVGPGLTAAKQQYFLTLGAMTYLDEKSLINFGLYGLPHYRVLSGGLSESYDFSGAGTVQAAGFTALQAATPTSFALTVDGVPTSHALSPVITTSGTYYTAEGTDGGADATFVDGYPVQPKVTRDIPATAAGYVHGALITGGSYVVLDNFDPVIGTFKIDQAESPDEHPGTIDGWWPAAPVSIANWSEFGTLKQTLIVSPGQFRPYPAVADPVMGDERLYGDLSIKLQRSTSDDWDAPVITTDFLQTASDTVTVRVGASDPSGIAAVSVLTIAQGLDEVFTLTAYGTYAIDPLTGRYEVMVPLAGADPSTLGWIVQVADGAGNVVTDTGKGATISFVNIATPGTLAGLAGSPVTLEASVVDFGTLTEPVLFAWDFGDGASEVGILAPAADATVEVAIGPDGVAAFSVEHTYAEPGTYTAALRVTDAAGATGMSVTTVSVTTLDLTTIYVSPEGDDDTGTGLPESPYRTIGRGIAAATPEDTVMVLAGDYGENVVVDTSITLQGEGSSLSVITGQPSGGPVVKVISGAEVTIDGFSITGGNPDSFGWGSGVYVYQAGAHVSNCVITGNTCTQSGGGVYATFATLTLTSNGIRGNYGGFGGGVAVRDASGPTVMSGNEIELNQATTAAGGGVLVQTSTDVTLTDNLISGNSASDYGGGVAVLGSTVAIEGGQITGNSAPGGGGIYVDKYTATASLHVTGVDIDSNVALNRGGGIYAWESGLVLEGVTLSGNRAQMNSGGGIAAYGSDPKIDGCAILDNIAKYRGGGLSLENCGGWIRGSEVIGNTTNPDPLMGEGDGAGMHLNLSTTAVRGNDISHNVSGRNGGGIECQQSNVTIAENTIVGNSGNEGAGINASTCSPKIENNVVAQNSGVGIYATGPGAEPIIINNTIVDNNLGIYGDAEAIFNCIIRNTGIEWTGYSSLEPLAYSNVEGAAIFGGTGLIDEDPLFVDPSGDYRLQPASTSIDAGTAEWAGCTAPDADIAGDPRPLDGDGDGTAAWDLGAYEVPTGEPPEPPELPLPYLTVNLTHDRDPQVSGDRVVWNGYSTDGGTDTEIFTWTPSSGIVQLTANTWVDEGARVSGDRIAWRTMGGTDGGTDFEIFTWTPAGGVVQLTSNTWNEVDPAVSGDRVVWCAYGGSDGGSDTELFTWTPTGGIVQLTVNGAYETFPRVSGDRIVWYASGGSDAGGDNEIFTWTPTGGTVQLTVNDADDISPEVSGDRVVWYGAGGSDGGTDYEIFTWTPTGGTVQLTVNGVYDSYPVVSGDRVAWDSEDDEAGGWDHEIYTWTPATGTRRLSDNLTGDWYPSVSGDRVVWYGTGGLDGGTDPEIFCWSPTEGVIQLTGYDNDTDIYDMDPRVSDGRVVWMAQGGPDGGNDWEICTWKHVAETTRLSIASDGTQSDAGSQYASVSADGRYVAFESSAANLVAGDTNGALDIFVRDRVTGQTTRVSVASDGTQGNGASYDPSISADGRYVAFRSMASNLVAGDSNGAVSDIFVHDRATGTTTIESITPLGGSGNSSSHAPSISADGRYVAFHSNASNLVGGDTNGVTSDVFVRDRTGGTTTLVSVVSGGTSANGPSYYPSISADGLYVTFYSTASDLVEGDTNGVADVFVRYWPGPVALTARVSVSTGGVEGNAESTNSWISGDGRYVAFQSSASNLVAGDTNAVADIFVHDRVTGATTRSSVSSAGAQSTGVSYQPTISADGVHIAFHSTASNLVAGDTNGSYDVFVHNRITGETARVSVASDGAQAAGISWWPSLSADGRYVAFHSLAANLVAGDTNGVQDIFVRQRW